MSASVFPQARINYFLSCAVRGLSSATELMSTQIIDEHYASRLYRDFTALQRLANSTFKTFRSY